MAAKGEWANTLVAYTEKIAVLQKVFWGEGVPKNM